MNKKARKLGMENTHFCDSTGLHNPDHYSTVKDIAVLMKYCIKNDTFREIVETSRHSTGVTNIHPDGITYYSKQCLKICLIRQSQVEKSSVARPAIPVRQGTVW